MLESKQGADYVPNLSSLAQEHYGLVIGVGFLMADALDTVAHTFPDMNALEVKHKAGGRL